ncbi:MAG: RagB/SusD family nutrient uptake outer membrane protein [Bacteroidetes bacterium]|nr:RagB/SusD family nutrient uptake outer membrane protein [Bacteroidota bacterium]
MKKILLTLTIAGLLFAGCSEEFLERFPTTQIDESAAFSTPENAMAVLYGVYDICFGTQAMGSWMMIFNEVRGDDCFVTQQLNWNFWPQVFNYQQIPTSTFRGAPRDWWNGLYRVVENANGAINADLPFVDAAKDAYLAEMKFMRAYAYFHLVQIFCAPYGKDNGQSPGVPVYEVSDASIMKGRGVVSEVYDLIESDLTDAIAGLPALNKSFGATRITKAFANTVMARVKMAKLDYAGAIPYIDAAIADAPDILTTPAAIADYTKGINRKTLESIFNVPFNIDDYGIFWGFSNFWDHPEGYGNIMVTTDLLNQYAANDVRREWYITPMFWNYGDDDVTDYFGAYKSYLYHFEGAHDWSFAEIQDLYDNTTPLDNSLFYPNRPASDLFVRPGIHSIYGKFPRMDGVRGGDFGSVGLDQPTLARTSELFLMKAECEMRKPGPNETAAKAALQVIQARAVAGTPLSANTGAALLAEIMMERRKELVGEGFRFLDILRLGLPLARPNITGPNWSTIMNLPAYDNKMIYPIPEPELDANPMMDKAVDQNPGY